MKKFRDSILFHIFTWTGSKLFNTVAFYCPDTGDNAPVLAIHFAVGEKELLDSCKEYVENR